MKNKNYVKQSIVVALFFLLHVSQITAQSDHPIVLAEQSFCDGATVADLVAFAGNDDIKWYSSQNILLDVTDILIDEENYYAENERTSDRSSVLVHIIEELVPPMVISPQTFCLGSLVSDLRVTGGNTIWYDAPSGGNIVEPSELLADGFYYASTKINNEESGIRSEVKVIIEETILNAPVIASPQNFCDFATLDDIATDGNNIVWYSANGALLPSSTALINATTYYAAYTAGTCESADRTPVLVYTGMERYIDAPVIASPQRFCEGATIHNIAVPNNQIIWYATATGNTKISSNTILSHDIIYYAAQKAGECESTDRTPVKILFDNPQGPDVVSPQMFCGTDFTLADLEITGSGIVWYDAATGGNMLPSSTSLTSTPTMYYAAQSAYQCESSRTGVLAYVNQSPFTPVISRDLTVCADEKTLDLTSVVETQQNILYTYFSDKGATVINDPENMPVPSANRTYYVKATDGATGCESENLGEINVIISNPPVVSVTPAGAYTAVYDFVTLTITDNNTNLAAGAKTATIIDETVASIELVNGMLKVTGKTKGDTEVVYTSMNENGCTTELIIPVQIEGFPTGILQGKDIVKKNIPGGKNTAVVQIAYVMGGVAPWTVTVSDDRGTFSKDTVIKSVEEFPVDIEVVVPQNTSDITEYTTYRISNIKDALGSSKQTHQGTVRIGISLSGTNPATGVFADFAVNETTQCVSGNEFCFSDRSSVSGEGHSISGWSWNFGDGYVSIERNPIHRYALAGTYTVTLIVTESPGYNKSTIRYNVHVTGIPVITDGKAPEAIYSGEKLRVSLPVIDWKGNTPVKGQWLLNGSLFDPTTTSLTHADNGKLLQYYVETPCGAVISNGVRITVNIPINTVDIHVNKFVRIIPNPVIDNTGFRIDIEGYNENNITEVKIYSLAGKELKRIKNYHPGGIIPVHFSSGTYIVLIEINSKEIIRKIIIVR